MLKTKVGVAAFGEADYTFDNLFVKLIFVTRLEGLEAEKNGEEQDASSPDVHRCTKVLLPST